MRSAGPAGIVERGRGMGRTLQEPGSPGERPISDSRWHRGSRAGPGPAEVSAAWERTEGDEKWGRRSEYISNAVLDAGRLSALVVLMTSGNTARVDPTEESGARSSRQGCNSAGGSPAASVARIGCEAMPLPGAGNCAGMLRGVNGPAAVEDVESLIGGCNLGA